MLLQIHDELVIEIHNEEIDKTVPIIKNKMSDIHVYRHEVKKRKVKRK